MKALSLFKKMPLTFFAGFVLLTLNSCNLMGFMDKPSGDVQLLEAARACLDKADYTCARDYYQALSNNYTDIKISETTLTNLAGSNIFFMADLIAALGKGTGGVSSIISLAEKLASRNIKSGAFRTSIQTEFTNSNTISDSTLRAYMKFIVSLSMVSEVLANAVGSDGLLTSSDLALTPSTCKSSGACAGAAACDAPAGTDLVNTATGVEIVAYSDFGTAGIDTDDTGGLYQATNWNTAASLDKLAESIKRVDAALSSLSGTSSGLGSALSSLSALGGGATVATARCTRQLLLQQLFP